jgi:hypothetical protein
VSVVRHRTVRGWALVAALAVVAVLAPQVPDWLPASAKQVDPATLRDRILASTDRPHQGYAEITGTLALPELPKLADLTSLLTTTTRVRTWYAGPDRWRFDVITGVGERDVYRTPTGEFTWDYGANLVTRLIGDPPDGCSRPGGTNRSARCPRGGWPGSRRPACGSRPPTRTPRSATSTCGPTRTPGCR